MLAKVLPTIIGTMLQKGAGMKKQLFSSLMRTALNFFAAAESATQRCDGGAMFQNGSLF